MQDVSEPAYCGLFNGRNPMTTKHHLSRVSRAIRQSPCGYGAECAVWTMHTLGIVAIVLIDSCTVPLVPFGRLPVEGVVVDGETGALLSGPSVLVRALSGGTEQARGAALAANGEFLALIPISTEGLSTDQLSITVTRGACDTTFLFDTREDVTFVDGGVFIGNIFRITESIRVPPCEANNATGL